MTDGYECGFTDRKNKRRDGGNVSGGNREPIMKDLFGSKTYA